MTLFERSLNQTGSATAFYNRYQKAAKDQWDSFFFIPEPRTDVSWSSQNPMLATVPFLDPQNANVFEYLQVNIEDEWKWNGWQLKLDFKTSGGPDITHVEFQTGVTPHVNGLGGSTIIMDSNVSLKDYNNQWTIRHEYGHTLGFPDCYVEFYDRDRGVMINYQIDINNLMCSRRGHLQETHFLEMKRVYYK